MRTAFDSLMLLNLLLLTFKTIHIYMYTSNIVDIATKHGILIHFYADDTYLVQPPPDWHSPLPCFTLSSTLAQTLPLNLQMLPMTSIVGLRSLVFNHPRSVISLGDPMQLASQSIGSEWPERRWNRHWEHLEDLCSLKWFSSRLPRFPYVWSLTTVTSSQLSYQILHVLWIQPSRRRKKTRYALLSYRRNAFSWCFSRYYPYLDTSGSWCPVIYEGHWSVASTSSWLSRPTTSDWKGYHNLTYM